MSKELCLFLQEWMITVALPPGASRTLYHPKSHQRLLELEPVEDDWEVYDAKGAALGMLGMGLQGMTDAERFCLLQREVPTCGRFFYAAQALTIGREQSCSITLADPYVSLRHCMIKECSRQWEIIDTGSTNGTYVNGRRIQRCVLQPGDVIAVSNFRLAVGNGFFASERKLALPSIDVALRIKPRTVEKKAFVWLQPLVLQHTCELPPSPTLPPAPAMPLLLQIAPGLTMALCSLMAAQRSDRWLQAGLLASMVLWPLVSALYQRVHWRRSLGRIRKTYAHALDDWQQHHQQQLCEQLQLREKWRTQLTDSNSLLRGGGPYLYLGEQQQRLFVHSSQAVQADAFCHQRAQQALASCCQPQTTAALYPLASLIWIIGRRRIEYASFLLMQLLKQMEQGTPVYVHGFSDLSLFGRLRFLRCFGGSYTKEKWKAHKGAKILLCEEQAYHSQLLQEGNICLVVCGDARRMDRSGLLVDLENARYWNDGWQKLTPAAGSMATWASFCVFLESDAHIDAPRADDFLSLFSCASVEKLPICEAWAKRKEHTLAVPIGWEDDGEKIVLDAHEKGDGPHGIVAGMTGSGKSELLLTYILSLAITYPPSQVSFFLVDYKGGAMAKALSQLPHICGVMTNLEEASLQRVRISLAQELRLRQQLFQEQMQRNNVSSMSLEQYARYRQKSDPVLGHLFVIVDEFAQLRQEHSEFLADLQRIARIGRSLGIHLLLCTQKPAGIIDDQIWSNARFHLCLRVQEEQDSRDMLHRNDAAHLRQSGEFLLQVGNDERFVHGQCAYANADYCPSRFYQPNGRHHLRIFDGKRKLLYHHTWQTRQSIQKQLPAICAHIRRLAAASCVARSVCMEELSTYLAHTPFCAPYQIGWIDQPQRQRIFPFTIERRSLLMLTPSSADAVRFLMNCVQAIEQAGERAWYYIGEEAKTIRTTSPRDLAQLCLLFYHLEKETSDAFVLVESMQVFQTYPQLLARLWQLQGRHQLILITESWMQGRLSSPAALCRSTFACGTQGMLREWFDESELPLMRHLDSGILQEDGVYSFLCPPAPAACTQKQNGNMRLAFSKGKHSVGVDEEGKLFFWTPGELVIVLYADPGAKTWIARWQREAIRLYSGFGEDAQMQCLAKAHRYDGTLCWIGVGIEEFGYAYGFRSSACAKEEMVIRAQGKEQRIQLWKGGVDE